MRFAVFILALAVRIAAIEQSGAANITFGDGLDYVQTAASVCMEGIYPERGNLPFFRPPGLPFFIAGVTACEPTRTRAIKYGLAACDAITVLLIFLIAKFVHRSTVAAAIAALLAALHPFFIGSVTDIRSEPLFMMLLVASIWLLLRGSLASSGVVLALATLTRPTGLLCIPLFAVFAMWRGDRSRRLRAGVVFLMSVGITLAPWVARNVIRFGEPILVNDAAGFNLWRGTHPELMRVVDTHESAAFARGAWEFEARTAATVAREVAARASTPATRDREWRKLALQNIRSDPFAMRSTLKKAALYWRPWLHPAEHGPLAVAMSVVVIVGLYAFGAIGLTTAADRGLVAAVLTFFAAMWLAHIPYFPSIRLRMPLTDPLLIVFAARPLALFYERVRDRLAGRAASRARA
jgi:4-amino-4-deoxy-L-arabinose transferase-like glycosyltransferase